MSSKVYPCQICGRVLKQLTHWKDHQATHSDIRNYKCTVCSSSFKTRGAMRFHYRKLHTLVQFYRAISLQESKQNFKQPTTKIVRKTTVQKITKTNKNQSVDSSVTKMPKDSETQKSSSNFNNKPIKCSICHFVIRHGRNFKKHMQRHKQSNRKCPVKNCGMKFTWVQALKLHMKEKHGQNQLKSEKIESPTLRVSARSKVMKYTEDEDENIDESWEDDETEHFEQDQSLLEEMPSDNQDTKLKISSCYSLTDNSEIKPKEEEKKSYRYECGECNIGYDDNDELWKHLFEKHLNKNVENKNKNDQPIGKTRSRRTR
ncbi:hypothetical protein PVAND_016864 [Polypedilum vanderplanki]|uniref:C2H2-type domain-containing protein n=1 Tax=Polypedilum vanderplanki TaxID=319348 RepID=A0A9J6BHM9_POLVA|nr:hypothetical protein PVAND_016864 [Polypedilum vanderplanki]